MQAYGDSDSECRSSAKGGCHKYTEGLCSPIKSHVVPQNHSELKCEGSENMNLDMLFASKKGPIRYAKIITHTHRGEKQKLGE